MKRKQPTRKRKVSIEQSATSKIYPYIVSYKKKYGVAPTLDEVAIKFKHTTEWVRYCLKKLVALNLVRVDRYKHRGIVIVNK